MEFRPIQRIYVADRKSNLRSALHAKRPFKVTGQRWLDSHRWGKARRRANRNDVGTLTSNKLNGARTYPAATQSNIISTPAYRGAVYDRGGNGGLLEDRVGRLAGVNITRWDQSHQRERRRWRVSVISACKSTSYFRWRLAIYAEYIGNSTTWPRCDRMALEALSAWNDYRATYFHDHTMTPVINDMRSIGLAE